jgi:hypothetical protein
MSEAAVLLSTRSYRCYRGVKKVARFADASGYVGRWVEREDEEQLVQMDFGVGSGCVLFTE